MDHAEDDAGPQRDLTLAETVPAQHRHPDAAEHPLLTPPDELGGDEQDDHEQPPLLGQGAVAIPTRIATNRMAGPAHTHRLTGRSSFRTGRHQPSAATTP